MRNETEIALQAHLVRTVAQRLALVPFAANKIEEACHQLERDGMPADLLLPATARQYAGLDNNEQLATVLASRIGDARFPPTPPLWPLLTILLLSWRSSLSPEGVMKHAAIMGREEQVQRGLAIIAYLFPELQEWVGRIPSRMPRWERTLALPVAARKLVMLEKLD